MATTTYHAQLIKYLSNGDQYILNLKNTGDDVSISRSSNGNLPAAATSAQGLANSLGALAFKSSLSKSDVGLGNVDNTADSSKSVKYATSAGSAGSATKATQDSSNQTITSTYIKGLSVSGRTITYTRGDGTTGTITTQDNNTTYGIGTSKTSGLTKLYTTTGSNTDGTMTQKAISSYFPTVDRVFSGSGNLQLRRSDTWVVMEGKLSDCAVTVGLFNEGLVIKKEDLNGNVISYKLVQMFDTSAALSTRHTYVQYYAGTVSGSSYVLFSLDADGVGLTTRKLPQYPEILATLNTNVSDFWVISCERADDRTFRINFNKTYSGSFIVAVSFFTWAK